MLGQPPGVAARRWRGIGAIVEAPGFYPYLSGRDNLRVLAGHAGVPPGRVATVLAEAGLTDRAGDRVATYSMGMKQRLGVAAALLKDPELLILDEPTNGLDPAGMAEMRDFIRSLAAGGRTVAAVQPPDGRGRAGLRPRRRDPRAASSSPRARSRSCAAAAALRVRAEPLGAGGAARRRAARASREVATDGALLDVARLDAAAGINRALVDRGDRGLRAAAAARLARRRLPRADRER